MTGSPFTLAPGESTLKSFPAIDAGPVKIVSNVPIVASERMIYKVNNVYTSYSEMMGLPGSQLDTTFWFPWYNNVDLDTQLRFANVSDSEATVHVYIGGTEMAGSPFTLAAGASVRKSFAGINGGPVQIVSDVPIVAAERVIYSVDGVQTSYSEIMGLPDSQLDTTYWFPAYNNVELDSQFRIANVSSSTTTVRLYVAGVELTSGCTPYNNPIPLAAGASVRVSCSGVNNGPVKVVSDVPIVAAERIIYKVNNVFTSYVEMMGFPDSELDTIYWMPRYNNVDPLNTELILAVGGSTSSGGEGFTGMSSQLSEVLEGGSSLEIESASETESTFDPYEITVEDGSPFWQGLIPGASQDSLVTFTNLHTPVGEQHSNGVWGEDSIQVLYDTPNERIQIWTYSAEDGWVQRGEDIPVTFADGDVLRARALEDGTVEIYHNGALLIQQGAMGSKAPKGSWFARFVSYFLPAPLAQASDTHTPTATQTATPIETPTATLSLTATTTPTAIDTPAVTSTPSPTGTLTPGTSTALATLSPTGTMSPSHTPTATQTPVGPITIEYVYDPLNRLTEANYSNNDYYHYTYDAVGNRKTQQSLVSGVLTNDAYNYDIANRLTDVNGVLYPWDDNGNLRNDGVNTYGYDSANRLKTLTGPSVNAAYSYNGLGDRLQETLNGQTTTFIMDLNTDLTQALSDGTNTYIYGVDRIAQTQGGTTEYFLDDALGSVRQMTSASGTVTYASAYDPYGVTAQTYGASQTAYGFTGEFIDPSGMVYLRARYYMPNDGRFLTRDTWMGDYNNPLSLNRWMYVEGNPINFTDPTGHCGEPGESPCPDWWKRLKKKPWKNKPHIYVEGYGYFDANHLRRGWNYAETFVNYIVAALNIGGSHTGMVPLPRIKPVPSYWVDYAVSARITEDQIYGVAYAMYMDFDRGYEEYQDSTWRFLSGFAPEDLPSDHLGFWANINGYNKKEIPDLVQCLGEVEVLFPQLWGIVGIAENHEFLPMIREPVLVGSSKGYRTKNIAWPSWLEIQPIPSGPNTWQVNNRSHK